MAIKEYSLTKNGNKSLAPAFKVREFRCVYIIRKRSWSNRKIMHRPDRSLP